MEKHIYPFVLEKAQDSLWNYPLRAPMVEPISILNAQNRVLGEDLYAPHSLPPFDRSPLDGYALRGEDSLGASKKNPKVLTVVDRIPAGHIGRRELQAGECARIFTGAPIPLGANAVLRQEDTEPEGETVRFLSEVTPGANISRKGEDVVAGEPILTRGTMIGPAELAILSALGMDPVPCYARPKVAILSTGDEIVELTSPLTPGKIFNSNMYLIAGYVSRDGGEPILLGSVHDKEELIQARIQEGLAQADLILTTGGVSVGDYDVVKEVHHELGAKRLFAKLDIKPGTPMTASGLGEKLLIGLSGNPGAAAVTYELTVRTLLRNWAGRKDSQLSKVRARLTEGFGKTSGQRRFLRGRIDWVNGEYRLSFTGKQNPGVMKSLLACNCLVEVPPQKRWMSDDWVEAILL
ncbi:molybdopterin molybdotransferase MoeA [Heliobacterium chlorum]|uniref:Molybdopterin molybdenumtransferase n=1 Tax=Heliobacterium chlorum TaxID=2698 RepID=A0ABR7T5X4_HELCL|nr:gephyrin-like molybdotransferase Glp [Heliobacterium chlorum]MBC9786179.1 molybdopterin molybdotransferase MoeA [Heliobacterium chlorum]